MSGRTPLFAHTRTNPRAFGIARARREQQHDREDLGLDAKALQGLAGEHVMDLAEGDGSQV